MVHARVCETGFSKASHLSSYGCTGIAAPGLPAYSGGKLSRCSRIRYLQRRTRATLRVFVWHFQSISQEALHRHLSLQ